MNLSTHFTYEELVASALATRNGLDNTPTVAQLDNLTRLAAKLEEVRVVLGVPLIIHSGFRSAQVNALLHGSATSSHCAGEAADFIAPAFGPPVDVCRGIQAAGIKVDQLIFEGTWVHIGIRVPMRSELLTAQFNAGAPTTYLRGLPA